MVLYYAWKRTREEAKEEATRVKVPSGIWLIVNYNLLRGMEQMMDHKQVKVDMDMVC